MGEYDYMMALWSQFCPTWSEDETSETLYRKLRDMLPKHQRKQLLRLIDSTNAHREMVSLESFILLGLCVNQFSAAVFLRNYQTNKKYSNRDS